MSASSYPPLRGPPSSPEARCRGSCPGTSVPDLSEPSSGLPAPRHNPPVCDSNLLSAFLREGNICHTLFQPSLICLFCTTQISLLPYHLQRRAHLTCPWHLWTCLHSDSLGPSETPSVFPSFLLDHELLTDNAASSCFPTTQRTSGEGLQLGCCRSDSEIRLCKQVVHLGGIPGNTCRE